MIDRGETNNYYQRLDLELELLRQTLTLTKTAMKTYEHTPLGWSLENTVFPKVEQICVVLPELFRRINGYRWGLANINSQPMAQSLLKRVLYNFDQSVTHLWLWRTWRNFYFVTLPGGLWQGPNFVRWHLQCGSFGFVLSQIHGGGTPLEPNWAFSADKEWISAKFTLFRTNVTNYPFVRWLCDPL